MYVNGITDDNLRYMLGVARRCREIAAERGLDEKMQDACFVLGFLHDIGIEKCRDGEYGSHAREGAWMAANFRMRPVEFIAAIMEHGSPENAASDGMIYSHGCVRMLNEACMTTLMDGSRCTMGEKLGELHRIYGPESAEALDAEKLIEKLSGE